jgi:hypothetical protein
MDILLRPLRGLAKTTSAVMRGGEADDAIQIWNTPLQSVPIAPQRLLMSFLATRLVHLSVSALMNRLNWSGVLCSAGA